MLNNIDYLAKRLSFETEVEEGRITTAKWYINQIATIAVAQMLKTQLNELLSLGNVVFAETSDKLVASQKFSAAIFTIQSGLEYVDKFEHHLESASKLMTFVENYRVSQDITLEDIDFNIMRNEISQLKKRLVQNLPECMDHLIADTTFTSTDTPDLLGYVLTTMGEEYFRALHENDRELAQMLLPSYLIGAVNKWGLLADETTNYGHSTNTVIANEPLARDFRVKRLRLPL